MLSTLTVAFLASGANAAWNKAQGNTLIMTADEKFTRIGDICEGSGTSTVEDLYMWGHSQMVAKCESICLKNTDCTGFDVGYIKGAPKCQTHFESIHGAMNYPTCPGFSNRTDAPGKAASGGGGSSSGSNEEPRYLGCYTKTTSTSSDTGSSGTTGSTGAGEGGCSRPSGTSRNYGLVGYGECRMDVGGTASYPLSFDVSYDLIYDLKTMSRPWKSDSDVITDDPKSRLSIAKFGEIYGSCVKACDDFAEICKGFQLILRDVWPMPHCRLITDWPTYEPSTLAALPNGMDMTWGNTKTWSDCDNAKFDTVQTYANGGGTNYGTLNSTWKASTFGGSHTRINSREGYFCYEAGAQSISMMQLSHHYKKNADSELPIVSECADGSIAPVGHKCKN